MHFEVKKQAFGDEVEVKLGHTTKDKIKNVFRWTFFLTGIGSTVYLIRTSDKRKKEPAIEE